MKVPFLDLKSQYQSISEEIDTALRQVMHATAFSGGPFVERFEAQFASFCQCSHAIGVGSGTEALWLALLALGIGRGDSALAHLGYAPAPLPVPALSQAILTCAAPRPSATPARPGRAPGGSGAASAAGR